LARSSIKDVIIKAIDERHVWRKLSFVKGKAAVALGRWFFVISDRAEAPYDDKPIKPLPDGEHPVDEVVRLPSWQL
jgi:hypothetical protein